MERKLRKYRDNLYLGGIGIIIFGIWSVLKAVLSCTLDTRANEGLFRELGQQILESPDPWLTEKQLFLLCYITIGVVVLLDLLLRLYLGSAAMKAGKGGEISYRFILVSAILTVIFAISAFTTLKNIMDFSNPILDLPDKLSIIVADGISFFVSLDMVISACLVKWYDRKLSQPL